MALQLINAMATTCPCHLLSHHAAGGMPGPSLTLTDKPAKQERFWFCMAPANLRNPRIAAALLQFATRYAARQMVALDVAMPTSTPSSADGLMEMEATHQVRLSVHLQCFPVQFVHGSCQHSGIQIGSSSWAIVLFDAKGAGRELAHVHIHMHMLTIMHRPLSLHRCA